VKVKGSRKRIGLFSNNARCSAAKVANCNLVSMKCCLMTALFCAEGG